LLIHPDERLERLAAAGVDVTVVQHFDEAVRRTPYDAFIGAIQDGTALAGLLMTPDAAFGFERRGTPDALTALGRERGFDVVVVPPFALDGRAVRSSDIRGAIAVGDLDGASALLGRPVTLRGDVHDGVVSFEWPLALPPDGEYPCVIAGSGARLRLSGGAAALEGGTIPDGPIELSLSA
jgi:riboflavin kinase/FMN adenylyltransferase